MSEVNKTSERTYQVSKSLNFNFDAVQDRLIIETHRGTGSEPIRVSLTRRMVIITLKQLLNHLQELAQLKQTPSQYWEEVLRMSHQQALHAHQSQSNDGQAGSEKPESDVAKDTNQAISDTPVRFKSYLAYEVLAKPEQKKLILAYSGFDTSQSLTETSTEQIFATILEVEHIHQLIQLLIEKAHKAMWHLPVDLSWIEQVDKSSETSHSTMQVSH